MLSIHHKIIKKRPLIEAIIEIQNTLKHIPKLLWIPSHNAIPYNEKVDLEAKEAFDLIGITFVPPNPDDFLNDIPKNKLNEISLNKPAPIPFHPRTNPN